MISKRTVSTLRALARAYGIAPSFVSNESGREWAPPATLVELVNALEGKAVLNVDDLSEKKILTLLREVRARRLKACLDEVFVAFDGALESFSAWVPGADGGAELELAVVPDDGREISERYQSAKSVFTPRSFGRLGAYYRVTISFGKEIPFGYYRMELRAGSKVLGKAFLISAPRRLNPGVRSWGAFAPAYAIRSERDWGIGSFSELGEVCRFVRAQGGNFVGTLPLLAGRMEGAGFDPSPYSPVSRLFWNEILLDVERLPGVKPEAPEPRDRTKIDELRAKTHVDYERVYAIKKKYIRRAAQKFFAAGGSEREDYETFLSEYPRVQEYAEFRAASVPAADRAEARLYHLYAQFACHQQLLALGEAAVAGEVAELYLDYPVGVGRDGFDVATSGDLFLKGFNVGAPPDAFSAHGQDWGFPPINPRALVRNSFHYFRDCLHNYFRYARIIRLDHIMGLYRIFCVPEGRKPSTGAYLHYPFAAFIAVLSLECHRHDGVIIGEDLGTVPAAVRKAMDEHGMLRMWLMQFSFPPDPDNNFWWVPEPALAAVNSHDMSPFAGFLQGDDIAIARSVGAFDEAYSDRLAQERNSATWAWKQRENPYERAVANLAQCPARFLLVTMEDLWGEIKPQNVPGTTDQYPNWRKKFRSSLEFWTKESKVITILKKINEFRHARM